MARKSLAILHGIWRSLYKPVLDNLFRESLSADVCMTPDVAIKEMEKLLESVFLSVQGAGGVKRKKVPTPSARLHFRFGSVAFRREAHHYAVDLFYNTYFSGKRATPQAELDNAGVDSGRSALQRATRAMSQPQMIREVLLKHGRPLDVDKIAEAIEKRFGVRLKRHDITSVIYRATRERKLFRKEGINTFALGE